MTNKCVHCGHKPEFHSSESGCSGSRQCKCRNSSIKRFSGGRVRRQSPFAEPRDDVDEQD